MPRSGSASDPSEGEAEGGSGDQPDEDQWTIHLANLTALSEAVYRVLVDVHDAKRELVELRAQLRRAEARASAAEAVAADERERCATARLALRELVDASSMHVPGHPDVIEVAPAAMDRAMALIVQWFEA